MLRKDNDIRIVSLPKGEIFPDHLSPVEAHGVCSADAPHLSLKESGGLSVAEPENHVAAEVEAEGKFDSNPVLQKR